MEELSSFKRLLVVPPILVVSGAKLKVRWPGSGQVCPKVLGVSRSSRCSRTSEYFLFMVPLCSCSNGGGRPEAEQTGLVPHVQLFMLILAGEIDPPRRFY